MGFALEAGRNVVRVDDGAGHSDSAVIYAEKGADTGLVQNLTSSNPLNPAYFMDIPIQAEWPFYDDFDGSGDNTFHTVPALLADARWIALGRPGKPLRRTALSFTVAPDAGPVDIFLMFTPPAPPPSPAVPTRDAPAKGVSITPHKPPSLQGAPALPPDFLTGFTDTGVTGTWRDNLLDLVPYALYRRTVPAGSFVHIPDAAVDYVVLLKPHT